MGLTREDKVALAGDVRSRFDRAVSTVLLDFSGVSVASITELRARFRAAGVEYKVVKNRLHLGLTAGTLVELDAELSRLQSLGASIAWEEEFPPEIAVSYRNVILRDIEGNEFCLGGGEIPPGS